MFKHEILKSNIHEIENPRIKSKWKSRKVISWDASWMPSSLSVFAQLDSYDFRAKYRVYTCLASKAKPHEGAVDTSVLDRSEIDLSRDRSKSKSISVWTLECQLRLIQASVNAFTKRTEIDLISVSDRFKLDRSQCERPLSAYLIRPPKLIYSKKRLYSFSRSLPTNQVAKILVRYRSTMVQHQVQQTERIGMPTFYVNDEIGDRI